MTESSFFATQAPKRSALKDPYLLRNSRFPNNSASLLNFNPNALQLLLDPYGVDIGTAEVTFSHGMVMLCSLRQRCSILRS